MMEKKKIAEFRKKAEKLIYEFQNLMDRSGKTTAAYKEEFGALSDEEFVKYIKDRITDKDFPYFQTQITPFEKNAEPTFEIYLKIAKMLGIELDEHIVMPYLSEECVVKKFPISPTKVPVGLLHLKTLQQMIRKKNKVTLSNEVRDQRTGQVREEDKGGRITDADLYALTAIGAFPVMQELYGPRADSIKAKEQFYGKIKEGVRQPRLQDLSNEAEDKVALNTLDVYFKGAGLMTDLVNSSYILKRTVINAAKDS